MRFATLCSGIGAPEVAAHRLGMTPVFCSEIEPFPCAVLAHRWPGTPNYGDMTKWRDWPRHDLDKAVWTEISASVWWEVTDRRADRPTLITANSSGSDFAKALTGAGLSDNWIRPALSRLMPIVGVRMTGEDLRKKGSIK